MNLILPDHSNVGGAFFSRGSLFLFLGLLATSIVLARWVACLHPEPLYDEPVHQEDIALFAKSGWSHETFEKKYNYAATLVYYLPSLLVRKSPSLETLRWYSLTTMGCGLLVSGILLRRWTGSWLPGAAMVVFPHHVICMATYMTEGTALLFAATGLLCLDPALRNCGKNSLGWSLAAGTLLGLAIVCRQIWVLLLGGLLAAGLFSRWRPGRGANPSAWFVAALAAFGVMVGFALATGGLFSGGGGRLQTQIRLSHGNWLLSLLAFLPVYGLGVRAMLASPDERPRLPRIVTMGTLAVAALLTLWIGFHDPATAWFGNGPVNRVLQAPGIAAFKLAGIFLLASTGLWLLLALMRRIMTQQVLDSKEVFSAGCLASFAILLALLSFPTPFYERYMTTPFLCALAGIPVRRDGPLWPWLIQIGLLAIFAAGVLSAKGLLRPIG